MAEVVRCYMPKCKAPGHFVGAFQTPFCPHHWSKLTPLKQHKVLTIATFSVLLITSRHRSRSIIDECCRYLHSREPKPKRHAA